MKADVKLYCISIKEILFRVENAIGKYNTIDVNVTNRVLIQFSEAKMTPRLGYFA